MKNLFLLSIIAVFAIGSVNAQDDSTGGFSNGDVFVSGSFAITSESQGDAKENGFTISPKVGFFVSDNIAVGAKLSYNSSTDENDFGSGKVEEKTTEFGAGVFGRYYFTPSNQFSFFGELEAGITSSKEEISGVDGEDKSNGFNIGIAPGISYFVSDNFVIETSVGLLGYSTDKADEDGAEATNNFSLGVELSRINFGIIYKF